MTLADQIVAACCPAPALWRLGGSGFALKYHGIIFCVDPLPPVEAIPADLILATSAAALDPGAVLPMLAALPRSKVVIPKSAAEHARSLGIPYERLQTTDSGLRVEFFKDGVYARVYAVPSKPGWTAAGGYPYLGYLMRFGEVTVYYPGQCEAYEGLGERLAPYDVTLAILPRPLDIPAHRVMRPDSFRPGERWDVPAGAG